MRLAPHGLVVEPIAEVDLGVLRSGKEAQINIVEWTDAAGATALVARKRYLPREVSKGVLEGLGVARATTFRHDVQYREGRQFRKTRDRRAVERMSTYGKRLLQDRWTNHEHDVMRALWEAGCSIPYPISFGDDVFHLQYIGDRAGAAPQLARAGLDHHDLEEAFEQVVDGLSTMVAAGWVHGDLSAYNVLWWEGRVVLIDFPQAVDLAANPQGLGFLHRDVVNICTFFARKGIDCDADDVFAALL